MIVKQILYLKLWKLQGLAQCYRLQPLFRNKHSTTNTLYSNYYIL